MYGTVNYGGPKYSDGHTKHGVVFTMWWDGSRFRLLHSFKGFADDGAYPVGKLLIGNDGRLYGTTVRGGRARRGTVFVIQPQ